MCAVDAERKNVMDLLKDYAEYAIAHLTDRHRGVMPHPQPEAVTGLGFMNSQTTLDGAFVRFAVYEPTT